MSTIGKSGAPLQTATGSAWQAASGWSCRLPAGPTALRDAARTAAQQFAVGPHTELFTQFDRSRRDHRLQLVHGLGAGRAGAATDALQGSDHLDMAVAALGHASGSTTQDCPGSGVGVDRVGLAPSAASLAIGTIDLDHLDALVVQERGRPAP